MPNCKDLRPEKEGATGGDLVRWANTPRLPGNQPGLESFQVMRPSNGYGSIAARFAWLNPRKLWKREIWNINSLMFSSRSFGVGLMVRHCRGRQMLVEKIREDATGQVRRVRATSDPAFAAPSHTSKTLRPKTVAGDE